MTERLRSSTIISAGMVLAGRYEILELLGEGGMGAVYKARQIDMDALVAIKLLSPDVVPDTVARQRLHSEARSLAVMSHPSIPKVHCIDQLPDGSIFLVMDLIGGRSLDSILREQGKLPLDEALPVFMEVAEALAHAHERGLVHRDLKPGNIMISEEDGSRRAYVLDFGIAKNLSSSQKFTQTGALIGTANYMSPEQASGMPLGPQSDLYSLACVLYETLVGYPVYQADTVMEVLLLHVHEPVPPLAEPEVKPIAAVLSKALAKDPADRFRTMTEFVHALKAPETVKPAAHSRRKISPRVVLLPVSVLSLILVVAGFFYTHTNTAPPNDASVIQSEPILTKRQVTVFLEEASEKGGPSPRAELALKQLFSDSSMSVEERMSAFEAAGRWKIMVGDRRAALAIWDRLEPLYRSKHQSPGKAALVISSAYDAGGEASGDGTRFLQSVATADDKNGVGDTRESSFLKFQLASRYLNLGNIDEARRLYQELATVDPAEMPLLYSDGTLGLAEIEFRLKNMKKASEIARNWLTKFQRNPVTARCMPWALNLAAAGEPNLQTRLAMYREAAKIAEAGYSGGLGIKNSDDAVKMLLLMFVWRSQLCQGMTMLEMANQHVGGMTHAQARRFVDKALADLSEVPGGEKMTPTFVALRNAIVNAEKAIR